MSDRRRRIVGLLLLALVARAAVRVILKASGVEGGYDFYLRIAQTFAHGGTLCLAAGQGCALRMPVYPMLVSLFLSGAGTSWGLTMVQAAFGAAAVYVTLRAGEELVGHRAAWIAAAALAVSPYEVVHDTALQDTVLLDLLLMVAVWGLLRMRRCASPRDALLAGLALGLAVLTTARIAIVVGVLLCWAAMWASRSWTRRAVAASCAVGVCGLLVGGWVVRNRLVVGFPVLTSESGISLWAANGPWTMRRLPDQSIDLAVGDAMSSLTPDRLQQIRALDGDDVAVDRVYQTLAWSYISDHPGEILRAALVKVAVPLAAYLSPARSVLVKVGYAVVYLPLHVLAVVGLWRVRHSWRQHLVPLATLAAFLLTTAVYWAHTSHAAFLDSIWFIYAAAGIVGAGADRGAKI